jgi:hypothetical protein
MPRAIDEAEEWLQKAIANLGSARSCLEEWRDEASVTEVVDIYTRLARLIAKIEKGKRSISGVDSS